MPRKEQGLIRKQPTGRIHLSDRRASKRGGAFPASPCRRPFRIIPGIPVETRLTGEPGSKFDGWRKYEKDAVLCMSRLR